MKNLFPIFIKPSSGIQKSNTAVKKRTAKIDKKFKDKVQGYYTFNFKKAQDGNPGMIENETAKFDHKAGSQLKSPEITKDEVMVGRSVSGGEGEKRGAEEGGHLEMTSSSINF